MRCLLHDLLPGQCECTSRATVPDYDTARSMVARQFGYVDEPPQVRATTVVQPTTDRLVRRKGFDIPTIGYGHWGVVVDTRPVDHILAQRAATRAAKERQALIEALFATPNPCITVTIG